MDRKKVLLVDDSKTSLFMERMILRQEPLDILTAMDGAEALEMALVQRPDLILMDVVMPRMNGLEALRALRDRETTRSIPVIMVTTRGEGAYVEEAFASGCSDFVTKPIDALELLTKVRSLVN
ncbi:MAG: response regulator [Vicinamibacteria bacterium]|nr:response regulator [Vicinamibacteria bacterium]